MQFASLFSPAKRICFQGKVVHPDLFIIQVCKHFAAQLIQFLFKFNTRKVIFGVTALPGFNPWNMGVAVKGNSFGHQQGNLLYCFFQSF